jgi:exoribonuclease-2
MASHLPPPPTPQHVDLLKAAKSAMVEHQLRAEFPPEVNEAVAALPHLPPLELRTEGVQDLRHLPWSSIDNQESRDLDQIEVAEKLADGRIRVRVGIADVDVLVPKGSVIDKSAQANSCSVYTTAHVFPMLPEQLSCGLTSLNQGADRMAVVIDFLVEADGSVGEGLVYRAAVRNHARLVYEDVGAFLNGTGPAPTSPMVPLLPEQLILQDQAAQKLRFRRHERGALQLETIEAHAVTVNGQVVKLEVTLKNRARDLIEDFMIAANNTMARFLESKDIACIRRVVKEPERWKRIVELAKTLGETLPEAPSSVALAGFLVKRRETDRAHFVDLSLAVVKLMGPGEYAVELPHAHHLGHFGLAVQDYSQSTAPNRRFADLITQRLVKAALAGKPTPYSVDELHVLAAHCMAQATNAQKVERFTRKVAAAQLLSGRVGQEFDAIVTGVTPHGVFVRLIDPPAEGRVVSNEGGVDVGDPIRVKLKATEPAKGFVDFVRVKQAPAAPKA